MKLVFYKEVLATASPLLVCAVRFNLNISAAIQAPPKWN
jgi:hypothetical protein